MKNHTIIAPLILLSACFGLSGCMNTSEADRIERAKQDASLAEMVKEVGAPISSLSKRSGS